ncbi:MAG: DUF6477 family protein [Gemmobacter sp.]
MPNLATIPAAIPAAAPAAIPAPTPLSTLRRPRLLIRAARVGLGLYRRGPALRRLFGPVPPPADVVGSLLALEARHEAARRDGTGAYSVAAHLEALIALMAEAQAAARGSCT